MAGTFWIQGVKPLRPLLLFFRRQQRRQITPRETRRIFCDLFRRAAGNNLAATRAAFGSEIHDPVRCFDHIQIVLDDDHGITLITQPVNHFEQQ